MSSASALGLDADRREVVDHDLHDVLVAGAGVELDLDRAALRVAVRLPLVERLLRRFGVVGAVLAQVLLDARDTLGVMPVDVVRVPS